MFISLLYEISLWILAIIAFPKLIYHYLFHNKYQRSLGKRLGIHFPCIKKGDRFLVWIHAVSVGELKAAAPLVKQIRSQLKNPLIVVSSVTETGHAEALRSLPFADYHVYLPFDFNFVIKPIIRQTVPDLVILSESDFWYNFLKNSKDVGASIVVVNAKLSKRSAQRFKKFRFFSKKLFSFIDLFCVQSKHYVPRFEQAGVPSSKIVITGNLKFDDEIIRLTKEQQLTWKQQLGIKDNNQVLVIGSTHNPEENLLLEQLAQVWKQFPSLKVLLVPRHPERFHEVASILVDHKIPFLRFSQIGSNHENAKVILIDAMGLLRKCYQLADVAIVGGSYTSKVGGHNILEPLWCGVPVIFGPHMHSQPELVEVVQEYKAGLQIPAQNVAETLISLLSSPEERKRISSEGLRMLNDINGATRKTWNALSELVKTTSD